MKITIALPGYWNKPSGGFQVHYKYAQLLSQEGHDVTILLPRHVEQATNSLRTRLAAYRWAWRLRRENRPLVPWFPAGSQVKICLSRNLSPSALPTADRLIATSWQTAEMLAHAPQRCGRKFYIVYDYEFVMTADPVTRQRIERTYQLPFEIIATSSVVAETILRCGGTPVAQIPCGLDFDEFGVDRPSEQRNPFRVGFPVRLDTFKGAADAIEAATILRERYGDKVQVTTFGSQKLELPDWITWLQYPSQSQLRQFYNNQAVFVLPSHFEGWGLPGVEAMACGAALVTANNGGSRDYAIDGETALVVSPRQPDQIAAAVIRLIEDESLRLRIARDGQAFVQRFTWQSSLASLKQALGA
jgi:glycosyltransferase involved in cell wall biosynthesis